MAEIVSGIEVGGVNNRRTHLHAPQGDEETLVVPSPQDQLNSIKNNRDLFLASSLKIDGQPLADLRAAAHTDLLISAVEYSRTYSNASIDDSLESGERSILLGGHQPTLFHPGVWFKNFFLDELAKRSGSISVNLIIDNDLVGLPAIYIPRDSGSDTFLGLVPYDSNGDNIPFERRTIQNREIFASFQSRLHQAMDSVRDDLIIDRIWNPDDSHCQNNLGNRIASMRHRYEQTIGVDNLELPLSKVCRLSAFGCFVSEVVNRAKEFRQIHNELLLEFRKLYRIRSRSHPVPELDLDNEWVELPFWIWTNDSPFRKRLFVRLEKNVVSFTDRDQTELEIPRRDLSRAIGELDSKGIALRPRALMTTMFSRMVLSDYFVHGIGGSKYDELTDGLIREFWGIIPPAYGTATATFRLAKPGKKFVNEDDVRLAKQRLWEVTHHPELHVSGFDSKAVDLVKQKSLLVSQKSTFQRQPDFYQEINRVNQLLRESISPTQRNIANELSELENQLRRDRIRGSREFSFVCFSQALVDHLKRVTCASFAGQS